MKFFLLLTFAVFLPSLLAQTNWCGLESCSGTHIDCTMSQSQFAEECGDSVMMLDLAPAKNAIVARINTLRNQVAGGLLKNKFAAVRMGTMRWNVTFANLARKNVKKCSFTHDECVNTPDFDFVGQNIARSVLPLTDTRSNLDRIMDLIDVWFNEHTQAKMADIRKFTVTEGKQYANFAQLVRDYSTRVGCAALKYPSGENSVLLFTCHFDLANVLNWPVYIDGPAARDCDQKNPDYPYLCSTSEYYNVNEFWKDFE